MVEKTIRLGTNRGQPRLWLEGKTLSESGFKRGGKFRTLEYPAAQRTLVLALSSVSAEGSGKERTVSGKTTPHGDHPIIDINGGELLAPFVGKVLKLKGDKGIITITVEE